MTDFITLLSTVGDLYLTKVFRSDGSVDPYDDAASFKVSEAPVDSLPALSAVLAGLHENPHRSVIRGKFIGKEAAEKGSVKGTFLRQNVNFNDCPHHWLMIDIDKYEPGFADPVREPVEAIQDYLVEQLPACFHDVSFHWQLSSSAGTKGKESTLKAHVWFWSEVPYTSAQLHEWAKVIGPRVDKAVFRRVQHHYTANPVFEEGIPDPVTVRFGLHKGSRDTLSLSIDGAILESARSTGSGSTGNDMKLIDPSEKDGIIGAYHRTYSADVVLMEHLDGMFAPGSNDRRWTWLDGGGTPEGVWVHDDGMHVGATHNTWPINGIVNLWDLVRLLKFGDLDIDKDDLAQEAIDGMPIQGKPSSVAMTKWAGALPEMLEISKTERKKELEAWKKKIDEVTDFTDIETVIAPCIRESATLALFDREQLVAAVQAKAKQLGGVRLAVKDARRMLAQDRKIMQPEDPAWRHLWFWDCESDCFVNIETKSFMSERSYNARFDRFMAPFADEDGNVPKASDLALKTWHVRTVDRTMYNPPQDLTFTMDGVVYLNLYRADVAADMPDKLSRADKDAIELIEMHAAFMVPDERERNLFLDYLAYCIQNPGSKIRWAPLLKGVEGDGKSVFVTLMAHILGHQNVRILDSSTLENSTFSGWGTGQCFTGLEEVKLHGHNKYDIYNKLKPYISNDSIEVHKKGKDPYNVPNTTNYLLFTNFEDAAPITENDRRLMCLRSPFNNKEDLFAAIKALTGMSSTEYFDRLFDVAIKRHAGAIRKWLSERNLSAEFSADGRAPLTAAREIVVELAVRDDETAVRDAISEGGLGVYPTLVSTWHLCSMVRNLYEMEIRTNRVSNVLCGLGFKPLIGKVKWRGRPCSVYYLGKKPTASIQNLFESLETTRENGLIDDQFAD